MMTDYPLPLLVAMYSGQTIQDLSIEEISSDRRNPVLADVMAQLGYMEKRGSGLKRICNETKFLEGYKEELKPVFRSTTSQFMTTIYSMAYETIGRQDEQCQTGTKAGLSWEQVGTKMGLRWEEVVKLFMALQNQRTMTELKNLYHWTNTTKFRTKYITPLIEAQLVGMTFPDKPTSPNQRYFLTDSGKALLANMNCNPNASDVTEKVSHMIGALSKEEKRIALDLLQREHKN